MKTPAPGILLLSAIAFSAHAADPPTETIFETPSADRVSLVELFSSQGCSSCPPAEAFVSRLEKEPGLWKSFVPVVWHVDYWNDLGWRDAFSDHAHTLRQHDYLAAGGVASVYTPGFVIDGREWRGFFQRQPLPAPGDAAKPGKLRATVAAGAVRVVFDGNDASAPVRRAHIALLGLGFETDVARGENAGRLLRENFVALATTSAPLVGGRATLNLPATDDPKRPRPARTALAVWVSADRAPEPLQATGGWLPTTRPDEAAEGDAPEPGAGPSQRKP